MSKKSKRPTRRVALAAESKTPAPAAVSGLSPSDPKFQALFKIRTKRWFCFAFIFAFLPICTLLARFGFDVLAFGLFGLFVVGHVLYRWLNYSQCPNCNDWFFLKHTPDGKTSGSGLSFPPISQCQHCGQSLFG